jgi:hypothetical protein
LETAKLLKLSPDTQSAALNSFLIQPLHGGGRGFGCGSHGLHGGHSADRHRAQFLPETINFYSSTLTNSSIFSKTFPGWNSQFSFSFATK